MWVPATPFPGAVGSFDPNSNGKSTRVNCLVEYNGDLIVAGNFSSIGGIVAHCIAKWNGTNWSTLGVGNYLQNLYITDICEYNNKLFVATFYESLHVWDGTQWTIPTYINPNNGLITNVVAKNMHVFNNELYFISESNLIKYDGTTFVDLNLPNAVGSPICIADLNNELYISTNLGVYKYNNQNWINCTGVFTSNPIIVDLEKYNGELYAIGSFISIGGISVQNFAKYNGNSWSAITMPSGFWPGVTSFGNDQDISFNSLQVYDSKLFVSAYYATYQTPNFNPAPLYVFNGTSWNTVGINYCQSGVGNTAIVYQGEIYAGGSFWAFAINVGNPIFTNMAMQGFAKIDPSLVSIAVNHPTELSISPNPTSSEITITSEKFSKESYTLCDQMGRVVGSGKLSGTNTTISLSSLSKGIYLLKVSGDYEAVMVVKE